MDNLICDKYFFQWNDCIHLNFCIFLGSFLDFYGKTRLLRDMALRAYSRPRPPLPLARLCTHFGDPPPPRPACVLNVCPLNELGSRKIYTKVGGRKK